MTSPTLGFSVPDSERQRINRLAQRHAGGNRSALLRHALDLVEQRDLFDTLARLQARGQVASTAAGLTRDTVLDALQEHLRSQSPQVAAEARAAAGEVLGSKYDELAADHDSRDERDALFTDTATT